MVTDGLQLPARRGPDPELEQFVAPASLDTPLLRLGVEDTAPACCSACAKTDGAQSLLEDLQG
jgi:hypothetical protein